MRFADNAKKTVLLLITCCGILCCHHRQPEAAAKIADAPAFAAINDSIQQFPKAANLYFQRANRLTKLGAHMEASPDFEKAWSLTPTEDILTAYAANLAVLGKQVERVRLLQQGTTQFPDNHQIRRLLADAFALSGNPAVAIGQYQDMLKKDSLDFETWFEKGLLEEQIQDSTAALNSLQTAFRLQPLDEYGLELAHLYAEKNNAAALSICNAIIQKDVARELTDPFMIKGIYYANVHQYPQALSQFDSCIRRDWKTTQAYIEKGIIYFREKKYSVALQVFQLATTVSNTEPDGYFWMGRCYEAAGQREDAILSYQRALDLDKTFTEAQAGLNRLKS